MAVAIRKVEAGADFARLHGLFIAYEAGLPKELRHGSVPGLAELAQTYAGQNAAFLATIEDSTIGCVAVKQLDSQTALMLRLFVRPESRGLGAARWLVTTAVAFARERGQHRMVLDTNKEQLMPAYRLYRSLGFEECEPFAAVTYECPTFMEIKL
jgi:GNAT superfamily N-acetyltransferase